MAIDREALERLDLNSETEIRALLDQAVPGSTLLAALHLALGDLDPAHVIVQEDASEAGSYWHGILHRAEGDYSNARYWFRRAGSLPGSLGLDPERITILVESGQDAAADLHREWRALALSGLEASK